MKILFVPDSLWGDSSGHRSSQYLIKAFSSIGVDIAVYAPMLNYTKEQHNIIKKNHCKFYPRTEYSYSQQVFRQKIYSELRKIFVFLFENSGFKDVKINETVDFEKLYKLKKVQ